MVLVSDKKIYYSDEYLVPTNYFNKHYFWKVSNINDKPSLSSETESENEFRPLDGRIDEFHPKATRTLFIGNLEKTTSYQQLLDIFQRFGEIVVCYHLAALHIGTFKIWYVLLIVLSFFLKDIDIKKVNGVPQYAFVQYSDIASVCKAIKKMDGEYLGSNRLKVVFLQYAKATFDVYVDFKLM